VSKGIAAASFQTGVPVVFGVLTTDTMQQALERAGIKSNHGWDYAMNAIEMASLMRQIRPLNADGHSGSSHSGNSLTSANNQPLTGSLKSAAPEEVES
jgi:6,7-dimethyl-8-ribityllumazine synthase